MPDPDLSSKLSLLDRITSFRVIYAAILVFILLYIFSVKGVEVALDEHFRAQAKQAIHVTEIMDGIVRHGESVSPQIEARLHERILDSPWVRIWGVDVAVVVLARDGITWLYVGDRAVPPPPTLEVEDLMQEAWRLLPGTVTVTVAVPHNSLLANAILVGYAALLLTALYFYNRAVSRREGRMLAEALGARDVAARRSLSIEHELETLRQRVFELEPHEREQGHEIRALQQERESLQRQLAALAHREEELRGKAARAVDLDQEIHALEDLLDEAGADLAAKNSEIQDLEKSLKRAAKGGVSSGRTRELESLTRRLRTLYKNLEIDDRAISDLVALRDETMKLKAEEAFKRLADDADNVGVRRKVGGLPPHLTIFELGFAGKGRIYYTRGQQRRFRILTVGAKNTQKTDLEYLSRLDS